MILLCSLQKRNVLGTTDFDYQMHRKNMELFIFIRTKRCSTLNSMFLTSTTIFYFKLDKVGLGNPGLDNTLGDHNFQKYFSKKRQNHETEKRFFLFFATNEVKKN
jgi:hypothetical protein